jgi:hypothetical protein
MHAQSPANPPPEMVPRNAKEAHKKSKLPKWLQKGKNDKPKIVELLGKASVLGMVTYDRDHDFLLVYDSQASLHFVCFARLTF